MALRNFGRYEIRDELGRGGMATVYRAYDPNFGREVAIKILPPQFLHDPSFRARFVREARIIAALEHSAIVPVHDFGEQDGQPYLVMRLMTGGSLAERLLRGPLSLAEAARLLETIAPALDDAHTRGVIHRDLKPGNILYDQGGTPYLSDFGIAKITQADATITGSYAVVGTPAYMSPEQARGDKDIDGRCDIYALGAILFEVLSGQVPYQAETPTGQIIKHLTEPVPNILEVRSDLPIDCQAVIATAMAKEKAERYQSAVEMQQALQAVVRGEAVHAATAQAIRPATGQAVRPIATRHPPQAGRRPQPMPGGFAGRRVPQARPVRGGFSSWIWIGVGLGLLCLLAGGGLTAILFWNDFFPPPAALITGETGEQARPTRTRLPTRSPTPAAAQNPGQASTVAAETIVALMTQSAQATPSPSIATETTEPSTTSLPGGFFIYSVQEGDDLSSIAERFGASVQTLSEINPGIDANALVVGQAVVIPLLPTLTPTLPPTLTPTASSTPLPARLIAYATGATGDWRILLADPISGSIWPLPNLPHNSGVPAWSPDGKRLAFRSNFTGYWQVYTIGVDGVGMQQLTSEGNNYEASWSPDGARLAFVSDRSGDKEIYTMLSDGSQQTRLTFNNGWDDDPGWSPDGNWLLFESQRDGRIDIYQMRADGTNLIRLTSEGEFNGTPAWSPDGRYIAFERKAGSHYHVWVRQMENGEEWQVTFKGSYNLRPAWSPDSRELAFTSDSGGDEAIWIISIFGGDPRRLSDSNCFDPAWGG